jgi:hypothetical protein
VPSLSQNETPTKEDAKRLKEIANSNKIANAPSSPRTAAISIEKRSHIKESVNNQAKDEDNNNQDKDEDKV